MALVAFGGRIGSSDSMRLPSAASLSSNSSLILLVGADSPSFSFPLEVNGSGNGTRVSGASATGRSSSCGVASDSPEGPAIIICCLDWAGEAFQVRRASSCRSWWPSLSLIITWRSPFSFIQAVSSRMEAAVECDNCFHLIWNNSCCLLCSSTSPSGHDW